MINRIVLVFALAITFGSGCILRAQNPGSISGRIVGMDAGRTPVRRAIVSVTGAALVVPRSVITDEAGQFTCANLPAGRYLVTASKPSYLTTAFGASKPGRPGTPVPVAAGETIRDVTIRLGRAGVIAGTIRDQSGQPVLGLAIGAILVGRPAADSAIVTTLTDDRGEYRIGDQAPGT
jgi:hypothetical protein